MIFRRSPSVLSIFVLAVLVAASADVTAQQWTPQNRGSSNIEVVSHLPLGPKLSVSDIEVSQELDRPYAFVGRMVYGHEGEKGIDIIDLSDERRPKVIHRWRIENQDLHLGTGGMDVKYFKWNDRWYVVQSLQFQQGGPDGDLGAVVLDVTDLPERADEVARIRAPNDPGGFHNIFIYKHSNGRVLLISTGGPYAKVHDLGYVVEGRADEALVATIPVGPDCTDRRCSYHDMYAGYHPDTDRSLLRGRQRWLLRLRHHRPREPADDRLADRNYRGSARPYVHALTGRPLCHRGDRIPVRAAANF